MDLVRLVLDAVRLLCPFLSVAAMILSVGPAFGNSLWSDVDGNRVVDLTDHNLLIACYDGPIIQDVSKECLPADASDDASVDLLDFSILQKEFGSFGLCEPQWSDDFRNTMLVRKSGYPRVTSLSVFDDGGGPALYAGGIFDAAGGFESNGLAKWNGQSWSPVGNGFNGSVWAMAVFDDGGGAALWVAGHLTIGTEPRTSRIVKWNGVAWSVVASEMDGGVSSLAVHDDGAGPALYAGGSFTSIGGVNANRIAKWNGSFWSPLGSGVTGASNADVKAMATFDDGTGPALFVGGYFTSAGGIAAAYIAKWNGSSWLPAGSGLTGSVRALAVFNDGSGSALYVGGSFRSVPPTVPAYIAKWNGNRWSSLGAGTHGDVYTLFPFEDENGPALLAGGTFVQAGDDAYALRIAKWNGSSWSQYGSGVGTQYDWVFALSVFDNGTGPTIYVGGQFTTAGGDNVPAIAQWRNGVWSPLGENQGLDRAPMALTAFDTGEGERLVVGGYFDFAGDELLRGFAQWDGRSWSAMENTTPYVSALTVFDDGFGSALYVGIEGAAGQWQPSGWITLDIPMLDFCTHHCHGWDEWCNCCAEEWDECVYGTVLALAGAKIGGHAALYVGGYFQQGANNICASYHDGTFSFLGQGLNDDVHALAEYDDGTGAALYAGGVFTVAGQLSANYIAKWNGSEWSPLGSGIAGSLPGWGVAVRALTVFDDGTGPALFVGGSFNTAGGETANSIAKWDGKSWSPLGDGVAGAVGALVVFDDGQGPALYAGGYFTSAGGRPANSIAKWDGTSWEPLSSGLDGSVSALTVYDDGSGSALYVGGSFVSAGGISSNNIAKWYRPTAPCSK